MSKETFLTVLASWLSACAEQGVTAAYEPVELEVDAARPQSGCREVLALASAGVCRGNWVCASGGTVGLICVADDAGLSCACTVATGDEQAGDAGSNADAGSVHTLARPCADVSTVKELARELCGVEAP